MNVELRPGESVLDSIDATTYSGIWLAGLKRETPGELIVSSERILFVAGSGKTSPYVHWQAGLQEVLAVDEPLGFAACLIAVRTRAALQKWELSGFAKADRHRWTGAAHRAVGGDVQPQLRSEAGSSRLSDIGIQTAAGLACPNCRSTQFRLKRHLGKGAAAGAVAGSLLIGGPVLGALAGGAISARKVDRVECVACGRTYERG